MIVAAVLIVIFDVVLLGALLDVVRVSVWRRTRPPHVELVAADPTGTRGFFSVHASKLDYDLLLTADQTYDEYQAACAGAQTSPLTPAAWELVRRALGTCPT